MGVNTHARIAPSVLFISYLCAFFYFFIDKLKIVIKNLKDLFPYWRKIGEMDKMEKSSLDKVIVHCI